VHMLWGKPQGASTKHHEADREELKRVFAPRSTDTARRVIVGHPAAGGAGLDFSGASTAVYLTNAPSLRVRQQSIGRIYRPGQKHKTTIADVVACGPKGQRTVDHAIIAALRAEQDVAEWTAAQWRAAVTGDFEAPTTWSTP
jgi:superfamily II DNA or RNA helicase